MKRTPLTRKTPMKRSRFVKRPLPKRAPERGGDVDYLAWIRMLPCARCGVNGISHAHHSTGAGMGLKSDDRDAMPLCSPHVDGRMTKPGCHREFHDNRGLFDGWTREDRRIWQELQVARCQALHRLLFA